MNAAKSLADYLKTVAAITALVGERIYWPDSPAQIAQLHLRVTLIEGGRMHNLDFSAPSIQVSVLGKVEGDVETLKEAVIDELKDGRKLFGSVFIVSSYADDRFFEDTVNGVRWWHAPITVNLKYQED